MGDVVRFPRRRHVRASSVSKTRKKSLAVTSPSVTAAIFSATSREGQPLPSQREVIQPPVTPIETANSPRLIPCLSRYSDSFMTEAFSPAKTLAQVKILAPLYGQSGDDTQQFSMNKRATQRIPAAPEPLQRTFIQEWRKHRKLSQTELGDAVGLSTATISQIENAKTGYSQATLEAVARVLKVHPIDLLVCDPAQHPKGIWRTVSTILA